MANSAFFSVLPNVGDLFVVAGQPATYTDRNSKTQTSYAEPGLYVALQVDAGNSVIYGALATGGNPLQVPSAATGQVGIPQSKILCVVQAR